VAVIIDTAPPFLYRAKALLQSVVSTSKTVNMVLIPYNSTGEYDQVQWRPLIIIADNVINQLLLSKSAVPKHSI
jgi:hypothetical protein